MSQISPGASQDTCKPTRIILKLRRSSTQSKPGSRCQPDIHDDQVECTVDDMGDYRSCISHFFGRNKLSTASIPHEYYPLLCRRHYQERFYRWADDHGAYAAYQCDNILKVLAKMSRKAFVDADGIKWPWWTGFELRIGQGAVDNSATVEAPIWLVELCAAASVESYDTADTVKAVRCTLMQLTDIVKAMKTWCVATNSYLPRIEALPATIGMCDMRAYESAKKRLRLMELGTLSASDSQQNPRDASLKTDGRTSGTGLRSSGNEQEVLTSRKMCKQLENDAHSTKCTLPPKRETKMRVAKPLKRAMLLRKAGKVNAQGVQCETKA